MIPVRYAQFCRRRIWLFVTASGGKMFVRLSAVRIIPFNKPNALITRTGGLGSTRLASHLMAWSSWVSAWTKAFRRWRGQSGRDVEEWRPAGSNDLGHGRWLRCGACLHHRHDVVVRNRRRARLTQPGWLRSIHRVGRRVIQEDPSASDSTVAPNAGDLVCALVAVDN